MSDTPLSYSKTCRRRWEYAKAGVPIARACVRRWAWDGIYGCAGILIPYSMESTVNQLRLMPTTFPGEDLAAGRPLDMSQPTVLLVEDNLSTQAMFSYVLKEQGYLVLTAGTYDDAQRICNQFPGPIHLLVTDVLLPKKEELQLSAERTRPAAHSGLDLARHMTAKRRGTRVLLMTGRSDEELRTMTEFASSSPSSATSAFASR